MEDKKLTMLFVYNTNNIKYYYNIASFFKMFGFVVGKYKLDAYTGDLNKKLEDYNTIILLDDIKDINSTDYKELSKKILNGLASKGVIKEENENVLVNYISEILIQEFESDSLSFKSINLKDDISKNIDYTLIVEKILKKLEKQRLITKESNAFLLEMFKLYQDNNMAKIEYISTSRSKEDIKEVYNSFMSFESLLFKRRNQSKEITKEELSLIDYARGYSVYQVKHHLLKDMDDTYDIYKVINLLESKDNTSMIAITKLLGDIFNTIGKKGKALKQYNTFIQNNEDKSYTSDTLYRIGDIIYDVGDVKKTYGTLYTKKDSLSFFEQSYSLDNDNYEALRNYAYVEEFENKEYYQAEKIYQEIIKKLELLYKRKIIELDELEILFKTYFRMGRLYLKRLKNSELAEEYFMKAINLEKLEENDLILLEESTQDKEKRLIKIKNALPFYQMKVNANEANWNIETKK